MTVKERPMIILDVDDTLTPHNSWTELTHALGASTESHLTLYQQLLNGEIKLEDANSKLVDMWRATGKANRGFIQRAFQNMPLRAGALALTRWLNQQQFRACLISGSMDMYVAVIADRLHIKDWYANGRLIFDDQGDLIGLQYNLDQSATKLTQLNEFCSREKIDPTQVIVVGDGANDMELFRATGRGILITDQASTVDLQEVAWKTVASLNEIPAMLRALSC
jgi:phosphoserine phosphatase